jgi:branched-chain amino acid transport system permease protein
MGAARTASLSVFPVVLGVLLAVAMQLAAGPLIGPFAAKLLMDIGINVILAVSLNLVNGFTGQFSIGHAGFMAVGGYVAGAITFYGSFLLFGSVQVIPGWLSKGDVLFVGGCLAGAVVAAAAGWIVGLPSLRLRGDYLAIVTLGFGEILRVLIQRTGDVMSNVEEVRHASAGTLMTSLGGSLGFSGLPYYTDLFWIYAFVTVTLVVAFRLKFSSLGRAFLSIRENEIAAEAVGVDTTKLKVRAFVLAAGFAGIAGGLFAHEVGTSLNPRELGFQKSFDVVIMVVLGGMGSVSGAVLAAIVLTLLPEALRSFSEFRMPIYALALILMMILRPQGLLGLKEIWEMPWFKRRRGKAAA